jgi:hypothetical protein
MVKPATASPSAEELALWAQGSRTVNQAVRETGLTRDDLFALMKAGAVRWKVKDLKGTRLIAWGDLVRFVASLPSAAPKKRKPPRAGAGAHTGT